MKDTKTAMFNALKQSRVRYYSQSGEDGLIEYLLSRLPKLDHWCVEFGAWDGVHLSNTHWLIKKMGYRGVLIEALEDRHATLCKNMQPYNVTCLNALVGLEGTSTLDVLLSKTEIPRDFDLLSIDIDGDDYHVWQSLRSYNPKIVIIEINIRDKPGIDRINRKGSPFVWGESGTSISSMTDLADKKNYGLVAHVGCNAVFVRQDLYGRFFSEAITPRDVFTFEGHSLDELTPQEFASARFWGSVTKRKVLASLVPRSLRPVAKKLYAAFGGSN